MKENLRRCKKLNVPGARQYSVSWRDGNGNLWLFGGDGYAASTTGELNDLWKFDGVNWTWVSGSDTSYQAGVYGTKGVAAPGNVPGTREGSISWIDGSGNLWLFGGYGYADCVCWGELNDLWKFDGANWTWVDGSNALNQNGVYGTKGVAASGNVPGARGFSTSWRDGYGNLWLFGGFGYAASGGSGYLNDLWKFVYSQPAADADLNGDGLVNMYDYAILASNWLQEVMRIWYHDDDHDGYGNPNSSVQSFTQPPGCVPDNTDCDDFNSRIHPGAEEVCDGIDNNCNGIVDDCQFPAVPHATIACINGQPVMICNPGWINCDGNINNGCECESDHCPCP